MLRELTEWWADARFDSRPWLVLGKGPTLESLSDINRGRFHLFGLNHVAMSHDVDVAHIVDVDVVEACGPTLLANTRYVVMPRVPHVRQGPGHALLEEYFEALPILGRLADEGRLVWYNARTAPALPGSPVIDLRWFSSEAALSILGTLGVREIRSLGIDGGRSYARAFRSLAGSTLLANGRESFDIQFTRLRAISERHGIDYRPLVDPLRIYVGCAEHDLPAMRVLEHSIVEHSSVPVRVVPMVDLPVPRPRHRRNRPRTGFSFSRFLIPELAERRGRAVYLDSDMLVFGDVAELAEMPFDGHAILCTEQRAPARWEDHTKFRPGPQFSVMVLDCEALDWDVQAIVDGLDRGDFTYEQLLFELCITPREQIATSIPTSWNHLERFEPGVTDLLHYTVVPTQPWRDPDHPLGELWIDAYRHAVACGRVPRDEVLTLVRRGLIRADLVTIFDECAPAPTADPRTPVEIALDAAQLRIRELESRSARSRTARALKRLEPAVDVATKVGPTRGLETVIGKARERARDRLTGYGP